MENKNTEKFALLNLIRALSGNSEQNDGLTEQDEIAADTAPDTAPVPAPDGEPRPNVLAEVLQRHEEISNRLRNNRK